MQANQQNYGIRAVAPTYKKPETAENLQVDPIQQKSRQQKRSGRQRGEAVESISRYAYGRIQGIGGRTKSRKIHIYISSAEQNAAESARVSRHPERAGRYMQVWQAAQQNLQKRRYVPV